MKYGITFLCLSLTGMSVYSQPGQIINGGFEYWSNVQLYEYPDFWCSSNTMDFRGTELCVKSTDAQDMTYSIRLKNQYIEGKKMYGYFWWGLQGIDVVPKWGDIYYDNVDQFNGYYKCNMAGNDSAYVIVYKTLNNISYPLTIGKLYGSVSAWTPFSFSIPAGACDSIAVGIASSNPYNQTNFDPASWIMIDNVSFGNSTGPAPATIGNNSFESWSILTRMIPNAWNTLISRSTPYLGPMVDRSLDSHSGTWCAQIHSYAGSYSITDSIEGMITNGNINMTNPVNPFVADPYTEVPEWFSGWYKYGNGTGTDSTTAYIYDTARVSTQFFAGGVQVGGYTKTITNIANVWTYMTWPLNITTVPDSAVVWATSGKDVFSVLKLDDLMFFGGTLSTDNTSAPVEGFFVYPNPASEKLVVECDHMLNEPLHYKIVDMTGRCVQAGIVFNNSNQQQEIQLGNLTGGMYTYCLSGVNTYVTGKFLKQ